METTKTQFEYRIGRKLTLVAIFDTEELAYKWLAAWENRSPEYTQALKLFKTTTQTTMEAVCPQKLLSA